MSECSRHGWMGEAELAHLHTRRLVLGQNVAQHVAQATEHGQQALLIALSPYSSAVLGARTEQESNACRIVKQRLAAVHILG